MPRIGNNNNPTTQPLADPTSHTTPTSDVSVVHEVTPTDPVADSFVTGPAETSPFEVYFAPYDPAAKAEIGLIDKVLEAREKDSTVYPPGENPYKINYAVYNLRSPAVISRLIKAAKMGVDVQVLVESKQIAPESHWNTVDDVFEDAGLDVIYDDTDLPMAEREAAHLVGIESNHLMHLKSRIYSYKDPDTGEIQRAVLSGSMNPGDGASLNDENLNLIEVPNIIDLYEKKFDDVLRHKRTENVWDPDSGLNVMFTPAKSGPRPIEKLFEWIDAEDELILLSVFDVRNIKDPKSKKSLVEKLVAAKDRGAEVLMITDRKKSDGLDSDGNRVMMYGHYASNNWLDEDLEKHGIPVYEFTNEAGDFNAVHPKAGLFGLEDIKVITGAGNWTRASIGSGNKRGRNEESFIFVESGKLDDNRSGMRYLSNALYLLRNYDHQNDEHLPAEEMIKKLQSLPNWPQVEFDPSNLLPPDFEGEAYLVGDHPSLKGKPGEPGLKITNRSTALGAMLRAPIMLPFGTKIEYDIMTHRDDGSLKTFKDDATFIVMPKDLEEPRMPHGIEES